MSEEQIVHEKRLREAVKERRKSLVAGAPELYPLATVTVRLLDLEALLFSIWKPCSPPSKKRATHDM